MVLCSKEILTHSIHTHAWIHIRKIHFFKLGARKIKKNIVELGEEEKRLGIEMSVWIWKRPIRTAAPIESAFL